MPTLAIRQDDFEQWLLSFEENTVLCVSLSNTNCPLAQWITTLVHVPCSVGTHDVAYYTDRGWVFDYQRYTAIQLPAWAITFIQQLSTTHRYGTPVLVHECLQILHI